MSLLDKATIITTPTAHSNGKLHSIKGGAVADFDVVRGSAATRVNAEGLIEDISIIGGEIINNGGFSNGSTDWTLGTGWSVADGMANASGSVNANIIQDNFLTIGSKYKVTYTVLNASTGARVGLAPNASTIQNIRTENGTYTEFYEAVNTNFYIRNLWNDGAGMSIDNISVKEIIDATNIPRIDYTTGEGVILTEPQSTNLIAYSEEFSNAYWTKTGASVISGFTSPSADAPLGAFKLVENVGGTFRDISRNTAKVASALDYSESFRVKPNGRNWVVLTLSDGTAGNRAEQYFDITNGVKGTSASFGTFVFKNSTITSLSGGYFDISVTATSGTELVVKTALSLAESDNDTNYTGNGTSGVYIFGAQLEALSYSTSYIPTSGAIATRLADSVSGAGDSSNFNSTEGVFYWEASALNNDIGTTRILSINDGSSSNTLYTGYNFNSNVVQAQLLVGGVAQTNMFHTVSDRTNFIKVAVLYQNNNHKMFINGVQVATDNSGLVPSANTFDRINLDLGQGSFPFYGKTKTIAVFSEALTDEELTCLTTI